MTCCACNDKRAFLLPHITHCTCHISEKSVPLITKHGYVLLRGMFRMYVKSDSDDDDDDVNLLDRTSEIYFARFLNFQIT